MQFTFYLNVDISTQTEIFSAMKWQTFLEEAFFKIDKERGV
jgi:hypothetical protein